MVIAVRVAELFCVLAAVLHWTSIFVVALRARLSTSPHLARAGAPGVSILRPVRGIENHIEETLRSAFELTYPRYEIIFCVANERDPIVPVVRKLMAEHPRVPSRLLIGDDRISINPKLNNVVKGWKAAAYDWIIMADSNVLMPPDYIERLLSRWKPGTGITSSPPVGAGPDGVFAELECGFLNTYQARWQLAADAFGLGFAHGKNMLLRRDIIARGGGIRALGAEAAEDAAATKVVRAQGLKAHLVCNPFPQPLGKRRLVEVWKRQLRWARLRRASFRLFFYPEILSGGFLPLGIAGALTVFGAIPVSLALAFLLLWYGAEALLCRALGWPLSVRSPLLWIMRDLMLPGLFFAAISGREFDWRGNAMDVRSVRRGADKTQFADADAAGASAVSPNASAISS